MAISKERTKKGFTIFTVNPRLSWWVTKESNLEPPD